MPSVSRPRSASGQRPPDGQHHLVPLDGGAVGEIDHVRARRRGPRTHAHRADTRPDVHAVATQAGLERRGVAGVPLRVHAGPGGDERRRDAVAREDLRHLDAGGPGTEDDQARGQLARAGCLAVGPGRDRLEALDVGHRGLRSDRDDDVVGEQLVLGAVVGDHDPAGARDPADPADYHRARSLQAGDVAGIAGLAGPLAADHVVATGGGALPAVVPTGRVNGGRVEQRLRGHAGPERAGPPEQLPIDDRDRGAAHAGQVGGGLAGWAGADDDEVELLVHHG